MIVHKHYCMYCDTIYDCNCMDCKEIEALCDACAGNEDALSDYRREAISALRWAQVEMKKI